MASDEASAPLLGPAAAPPPPPSLRRRLLARLPRLLGSRAKHFAIMAVVALDVAALLANVFIRLVACEMRRADDLWVRAVTAALDAAALVVDGLFVLELAACLLAFGFSYFSSWFHVFDAAFIVVGFVIDVAFRGPAESIGSLVVALRLWRLAKISEEVVVGDTERMELLEHHLVQLEMENKHLRSQLGLESVEHSGHE